MEKIFKVARIVFFVIWISLFLFVVIYEVNNDRLPYSRSAQITELDICKISYSEQGTPESVTVCGYIEIEPNTIARLSIRLFQMPDKNVISRIDKNEKLFEEGYFSRELSLEGTTGSYLIVINLFREVIGTINFDVSER